MSRDMVHSVNDILAIAEEQKMPLEQMRFFINQDYKEPKAFGIFQDPETLEWVVYKNKADGTRAERYRGFDEEYAARELFEKLESEIMLRREKYNSPERLGASSGGGKKKKSPLAMAGTGLLVAAVIGVCIAGIVSEYKDSKHRGYYRRNDQLYYFQDGSWYWFDDIDLDWEPYYGVEDESEWFDDYYYGTDYGFDNPSYSFDNSDYYKDDDGGDWWNDDNDWGGWDAGDTDWDTDW